jgi:CRP-like cAMP-binding protein
MTKDTKKSPKTCDLQSCFLCSRCLDEWIPVIGAHRKNSHFKKGQVIFKEGDPVLAMYFVYKGVVKVHKQKRSPVPYFSHGHGTGNGLLH